MRTLAVLQHYGSVRKVADALGISRVAVSKWRKAGIVPEGSAYKLQSITDGALQVDPALYALKRGATRALRASALA